jgi:hypothetical protein
MTMEIREELDGRVKQLTQKTKKLISDITNFDTENNSIENLEKLFKELGKLKEEVDDEINMVEVEDFLLNGPGIKNKNI